MPEPAALVTTGLSKSYRTGHIIQGRRPALQDLDLEVRDGEIFGYVGPNGSGKTTTLKLLDRPPEAGPGRRPGAGGAARLARVALPRGLPAGAPVPLRLPDRGRVPRLRGPALRPAGAPRRRERARELLALVGLERSADLPLRRFSKGMVQRAGLAQALVNDPELVILDEPMSGLDPIGRRLVRDLILGLRRAGKTVFFSTHILSDAETLCDRVGVLRAGRLVRVGALGELLRLDVQHMEVFASGPAPRTPPASRRRVASAVGEQAAPRGGRAGPRPRPWPRSRPAGGRVLSVQPVRQTLEDYFFREMGGRRGGRLGVGRGMSRLLAVAANTFRETVRERVLYNLVFFAILMTLSGLLLGQLSIRQDEKILKDIGLAADGPLRHAHRRLHRGGPREQGDRAPLALPAPREAAHPRRVLPRQVRGARLHPPRQRRGDDRRASSSPCSPPGRRADPRLLTAVYPILLGLLLVVAFAMLFSTQTSAALAAVFTVGVVVAGRFADVVRNMREVAPGVPPWLAEALYAVLPELPELRLQGQGRLRRGGARRASSPGSRSTASSGSRSCSRSGLASFRSRDFQ